VGSSTLPSIFSEDVACVLQRLQTNLETGLGRSLAPADVEMLILNVFAYEIQLLRMAGNQAFRQNLVDFSTAPMLDYLAALVGVTREPAAGANCTLQFNFVSGANSVLLPAGLRVQSVDGQVIFATSAAVNVAAGTPSVTVDALCQTTGAIGNGYTAGNVSVILDPQPFVTSVANIDTTSGGNDAETDVQLRARVKIAPSAFSVAGPTEAYVFFAKSADPSIVDVACVTTAPGVVTLYPLCTGGTLSSGALKDAILATCSDSKVRPQNDTVLVADPTVVSYTIDVTLTIYTSAVASLVLSQVNANLSAYVQGRVNSLGMDIVISQIIAQCSIAGQVYNVVINSPTANMVADDATYTNCTGINVTIGGSADG
jgi:phage-related baseplate assembly protein